MSVSVERLASWAAVVALLLSVLYIAYAAGQISRDLELLRYDVEGHIQQWMDWILQQR